ncbi:MAG: hypothetical protein IT429_11160 [Gemmataceae bacterium]|nr:hypothetical protein [Gemmataceae bacterium]
MNYTVNWSNGAINTLATIWTQSADRGAVTRSQDRIDRLLAADPLRNGSALSEGLYAIEVHPLRALFEVDANKRSVKVVSLGELP